MQKVSQHVTIFCMFSFLFLNPGCQTSLEKKTKKQTGCTAQDEEMKWSNSGFTRLLPCKYLCRKESPVPTPISLALVLRLLPDQLMVRTQNFFVSLPSLFPHPGAEPVRKFQACVMIIFFFIYLFLPSRLSMRGRKWVEPPRWWSAYRSVMMSDCR